MISDGDNTGRDAFLDESELDPFYCKHPIRKGDKDYKEKLAEYRESTGMDDRERIDYDEEKEDGD